MDSTATTERAHTPVRTRRLTLRRSRKPASPGSRRGQALVEFAIIVPVMMVILLIVVDFGRMFFSLVQVNNAAREAANYGAGHPADAAGILAAAQQEMNVQRQGGQGGVTVAVVCHNPGGSAIDCSTAQGGSAGGSTMTVTAHEQFTFITPIIGAFFGGSVNMSASTTSTVLGWASGGGSGGSCSQAPSGDFTWTLSGTSLTVDATAMIPKTGDCAITGYNWDMGDGTTAGQSVYGIAPDPYTYSMPGTYNVQLCVTNPVTPPDGYCITHSIAVGSSPTASPTATPTPTPSPTAKPSASSLCGDVPSFTAAWTGNPGSKKFQYTFYGAYTGNVTPSSWTWNFGDAGSPGSGQNISNNYSAAGTYTVTMTITYGTCHASVSETVVVKQGG